jgi:hypothetical protein
MCHQIADTHGTKISIIINVYIVIARQLSSLLFSYTQRLKPALEIPIDNIHSRIRHLRHLHKQQSTTAYYAVFFSFRPEAQFVCPARVPSA